MQLQPIYKMEFFNDFNFNSKVWIYQASKPFSDDIASEINSNLLSFVQKWDSHGTPLKADVQVFLNQFILIAVDEEIESPSGCSIDRSVKKIKELGSQFNIDFFNRLKMVITNDSETKTVSFADLDQYTDWKVYNPLVKTVKELNTNFLVSVKESGLIPQL